MNTRDVLRLLHHELGATPVDPALYACPVCGTPTQPQCRSDTVHASLCLPCTLTEINEADHMTHRIRCHLDEHGWHASCRFSSPN